MQKYIFLLASILFIVSCKKNNESSGNNNGDEDDCVMGAASGSGEIIATQYIIAYNPAINSRTTSRLKLDEVSKAVLQKHDIKVSALKQSFVGEPGGFIAKISAAEAEMLRHDHAIGAVEPDRIISLGNCFTVVEPRLITWNIKRIGYGNGIGKTAWIIDSG
ncbi:MAG TPA: S8 family peptidase, partial [Chitinophagaceae bacterium]